MTGRVWKSADARKLVAPNSPSAIAKDSPAANPIPRATIGPSTVSATRSGLAPRVAAASLSFGSTERRIGMIMRTTTGSATTAWANGTSEPERASSGNAICKDTMKPKPIVTPETPTGNITAASTIFCARPNAAVRAWRESHHANGRPAMRVIHMASDAVKSELRSVSNGVEPPPKPVPELVARSR